MEDTAEPENATETSQQQQPEFKIVMQQFLDDLCVTFPEIIPTVKGWWDPSAVKHKHRKQVRKAFNYCKKMLPPVFFDILYQNADIFGAKSAANTMLLPGIDFRKLWKCDISDATRETIWKYLQLLSFHVVGSLQDTNAFGDTQKIFEAISEDDFKNKLEETLKNMEGMFPAGAGETESTKPTTGAGATELPDAASLKDHIRVLMKGKLGILAQELAEEIGRDMDIDMSETADPKNIFKKLIKNPANFFKIVKTLGTRLDDKIKSGEIKQSEILSEAKDVMDSLGTKEMSKMFQGMSGMMGGGGGKVNASAMKHQLDKQMRAAKLRERMLAKAAKSAAAKSAASASSAATESQPKYSDEELHKLFNAPDHGANRKKKSGGK